MTASDRLTNFVLVAMGNGVPEHVLHEVKRLLLNQLKASVGAIEHDGIQMLNAWAGGSSASPGTAHVVWLGTATRTERAAFVNGALFDVLDFNDVHMPTYIHAVSAVLPAALAVAEEGGHSGYELLASLALGIEVELACVTALMPSGLHRGFVPAGLAGGVGAATACGILGGLDRTRLRNALGLAMSTAGGVHETIGSMALSCVTGVTARNGLTAYQLAAHGIDAPASAFEGEKGMLSAYSDEPVSKIDEALASLGEDWRIRGLSYKTMPTETRTQAALECALRLRELAGNRQVERMQFGVAPIVVNISHERERFGAPSSDLQARFDLKHCVAAAWVRGRFTLAEMKEPAYTDPNVLALRSRVELIADDRQTLAGCWLEVSYTDGSKASITVDAFRGSEANPITDEELAELFRTSAADYLPGDRSEDIVEAVLALDEAPDIHGLMSLLTT